MKILLTFMAAPLLSSVYATSLPYNSMALPETTPRVHRYDGFITQLSAIERERQLAQTKLRLLEDRMGSKSGAQTLCASRVKLLANPFSAVERAAAWFQGRDSLNDARRKQIEAQETIDRAERVIDDHIRNWLLKFDPEFQGLQSVRQNLDGALGELFQLKVLIESRAKGKSIKSFDVLIGRARLYFERVVSALSMVGMTTEMQISHEFQSLLDEVSALRDNEFIGAPMTLKNLMGIHQLLRSIRHMVEARMNEKVSDLRETMAALRQ